MKSVAACFYIKYRVCWEDITDPSSFIFVSLRQITFALYVLCVEPCHLKRGELEPPSNLIKIKFPWTPFFSHLPSANSNLHKLKPLFSFGVLVSRVLL